MALTQNAPDWSQRLAVPVGGLGGGAIAAIMAQSEAHGVIKLSGGLPDPAMFPAARVAAVTAQLMTTDPVTAMQYSPTRGLAGVRDAIACWRETTGDRRPGDDELMVTSGGIDALGLLARSFVEPGDVVVVEAPTYLGAIMAFRGQHADIRTVPMDEDGLDVDALATMLATGIRPKLLYTIPDHHNPTGISLSARRRRELVELSRRHGVLIVEDVAYRDLSFSGDRENSLWSLAPDAVVQIGTFSKIFFPGVRLGWAAGPPSVVDAMITAKQNTDQCAGALGQQLAAEMLRSGELERHLVRLRQNYASRWATMLGALEERMPPGVTWTVPAGGFFTWLSTPEAVDTTALADRAAAAGVLYVPGPLFDAAGRFRQHLRLSFSCAGLSDLAEGVARLAALVAS
ncbi:MAG TPA: PLP-dependent aminotransferase family protein [Pseudonocardia sp.]|jgi:2-aminoadipate transaminase